jgi:hypothetical protein
MPGSARYAAQHALLDHLVRGDLRDQALKHLRHYFTSFDGRHFDRFEGGGVVDGVRNVITAADVLSLSFLGIDRRLGRVAIAVMDTHAAQISELLSAIPLTSLHEADKEHIGPDSAAWRLWELLRCAGGTNRPVTAYKLLARKRPALMPVYDRNVKEILHEPRNIWECYWSWFHDDQTRTTALAELRAEVAGIDDISLLRCLDVPLWMMGEEASHSNGLN